MATLNSETNYYELDSASTLGLHLEAGASDGLIAQAQEILATKDGSASTVQTYLDDITATVTANKVASADSSVTITAASTGTDLSVTIDNDTILKDSNGALYVSDEALVQYVGSDAIAISDTDSDNNKTVSLTISSSDKILTQSSSGLIANLTISERTSELDSENYRAQYDIYGKNSTLLGTIPVYKDSTLSNAYLGTTTDTVSSSTGEVTSGSGEDALCLVYYLADGTYSLVAIDVSSFLRESEFGDGLQVVSSEVSVLIDPSSEEYLTVSSSGVKLSGVDDAIETAINALDVSSVGATGYYIKTVSQTDGKVSATRDAFITSLSFSTTSTVAPTSAAVVSYVDSTADSINSTIEALDLSAVGGSGYMITTVSQTDGKVAATAVTASASNISATASSATSTAVAVSGTTVAAQISSLATSIQTMADNASDELDTIADALPDTVVTAVGTPSAGTSTVTFSVSTATKGNDNTYGSSSSATKTIPTAASGTAGVIAIGHTETDGNDSCTCAVKLDSSSMAYVELSIVTEDEIDAMFA